VIFGTLLLGDPVPACVLIQAARRRWDAHLRDR
jgi:hypothetical protein